MKSAITASGDSIEASLKVRTAEMSVTFLQQEYEKTKTEQESAEVSIIITLLMFATFKYLYNDVIYTCPNSIPHSKS